MKTNYSRPSINRKAQRDAPYHKKKVVFNVHLSRELRAKNEGIRSLPVRTDDVVLILRGKYAGLQKRVTQVSFKKGKIQVEGVKTTKTDGTEIFHYIYPSNCLLMSFGKMDDSRKAIIDRKISAKKENKSGET